MAASCLAENAALKVQLGTISGRNPGSRPGRTKLEHSVQNAHQIKAN
jgi:hypothetical protein